MAKRTKVKSGRRQANLSQNSPGSQKKNPGMTWLMRIESAVIILIMTAGLTCCRQPTMNDIIQSAPSFRGTVIEVTDSAVLVETAEGEEAGQSSSLIWVSLETELEDGRITCYAGDGICVYYDGTILETYPLQVNNVYAITLVSPSELRNMKDTYQK